MIERYYRPTDLDEALKYRMQNPKAAWLAGGTQLNMALCKSLSSKVFIDLREVVPSGIELQQNGLFIGANTTLQDIADSTEVPGALAEAAGFIPTRSVRNQATIGGNIGAARPASCIIPVLLALDAVLLTVKEGEIPLKNFLEKDADSRAAQLILQIRLPVNPPVCVAVKESRSHLAAPVVSAAVSLKGGGSGISGACVILGCVALSAVRLESVEKALVEGRLTERDELEEAIKNSIEPHSDLLGSSAYKKYINAVVVADAVLRCREALK